MRWIFLLLFVLLLENETTEFGNKKWSYRITVLTWCVNSFFNVKHAQSLRTHKPTILFFNTRKAVSRVFYSVLLAVAGINLLSEKNITD